MSRRVLALLFLILLTACGASKSGISTDDLGIVKVDNDKEIVRYGMSRANVEKVLGESEESKLKNMVFYENGVAVIYRDNSVVAILIGEESKGIYKTTQGAEINMNKEDIKNIYGNDNAIEKTKNLDYIYDSVEKKYLTDMPVEPEDRTKIYHVSVMFNDNGEVEKISVLDNNAAVLAK
ncbi:hypothetical protein A3844_02865 [Paenibacillus helianthi]|uniref:DUF4309 domain-containing protein n=1 Tax=Paenibacillus helianthi TaxID=1349432 RepID=A0ABX3EYG6_9BACL|nr:hypothetical protein [Paenibacillus helianthi]OKP92069.1 hypothetical protein A3844_02865 [Paenibacillus helianthi]